MTNLQKKTIKDEIQHSVISNQTAQIKKSYSVQTRQRAHVYLRWEERRLHSRRRWVDTDSSRLFEHFGRTQAGPPQEEPRLASGPLLANVVTEKNQRLRCLHRGSFSPRRPESIRTEGQPASRLCVNLWVNFIVCVCMCVPWTPNLICATSCWYYFNLLIVHWSDGKKNKLQSSWMQKPALLSYAAPKWPKVPTNEWTVDLILLTWPQIRLKINKRLAITGRFCSMKISWRCLRLKMTETMIFFFLYF